jgi:hypothetical protein
VLLEQGRLPECWIPPAQILECRALLEAYHDLRREHTAWIERIHAVFFHQGAPRLGEGALRTEHGLAALRQAAAIHLSPAGQLQVATALDMLYDRGADGRCASGCCTPPGTWPAPGLQARLYGVAAGPLAMTCWLGGVTGSPPRARRSGSPGWMSPSTPPTAGARPGTVGSPEILRWVAMRPARPRPRRPPARLLRGRQGPTDGKIAAVPGRKSSARPATSWPSSATTRSPPPEPGPVPAGDRSRDARPGRQAAAAVIRWGTTAASSRSGCQLLPAAQGTQTA